ncbi:cation:proton antiporter subunit C [uncultured Fretibacterium sp.]|jgi:Na(+)/H(+) antiporter subunit C|uniref:sodium:proton antiporter n=1 Tax=uncultured Fretibacterium sp. TaxID=1678694 RepID=UPI0028DB12E7|nr:cation:proton antiporter subunit C [uncultured Fretibacterium sp.]
MLTEGLFVNHYEAVAVILSGIGLTNLLLQRNMIKKIIGLNIMDTAVYLFLAAKGYVAGRAAPIVQIAQDGIPIAGSYVNPIPAGLVLTGIVVSVSVTAFALSLTLRLYEAYGTLDIDEVIERMRARRAREEGEP